MRAQNGQACDPEYFDGDVEGEPGKQAREPWGAARRFTGARSPTKEQVPKVVDVVASDITSEPPEHSSPGTRRIRVHIYIYIYIHIYVCVCVCVCFATKHTHSGVLQVVCTNRRQALQSRVLKSLSLVLKSLALVLKSLKSLSSLDMA